MQEPLMRRREVLAEVCKKLDVPEVEFSHSVVGAGTALYQAVVADGQEGIMAKQHTSMYRPRTSLRGVAEDQASAEGKRFRVPGSYLISMWAPYLNTHDTSV